MLILYIGLGGALGAVSRFLITSKISKYLGLYFPYGTIVVNILGSLLIGFFIEYLVKTLPHSLEFRAFVVTGFLGGFTTFSAFSLDAVSLFQKGNIFIPFSYIFLSVSLCILSVIIGMWISRQVL